MSTFSFIVFLFILIVFHYQDGLCQQYEPVLSQNGDVQIVCLLDIHKSYSSIDAKCSEFRPKTMFVALTALWKWNKLSNVTGPSENIGLTVYDTCGSEKRAVQIMSSYLTNSSLLRSVAGIITYTSPEVTSAVFNILRHMDVIHLQIVDDKSQSCQWTENESCLSFPLHSDARAEAAVEVAGILDWTYMSVFGIRQDGGQSDMDLFVNMTKEGSICVASTRELDTDLSSSGLSAVKSKAAVIFTGDSLINSVPSTASTLLVVTTELPPLQREDDRVALLIEDMPRLEGIVEYWRDLVNSNISFNIQGGYLQTDSECFHDGYLDDTSIQLKCASLLKTNYANLAIVDAMAVLQRVAMERIQSNCSDDTKKCSSVITPTSFINDELSFFTFNGRTIVQKRPTFSLIFPGNTETQTTHIGNIETPATISTSYYESHCEESCFECTTCQPSFSSDEKVMFDDADLLLIGVFPIHTSAPGRTCSVPNVRGFKIAQAFTHAIQMLSENSPSFPHNISFGGVVFDSCGDQTWFAAKHHEIENCLYRYKNSNDHSVTIQPSKTLAYFNTDLLSGFNNVVSTAKLSLTISDIGITFDSLTSDYYIDSVIKTLKEIKWTYVYFVVSDSVILKQKAAQFETKASEHGVCVGGVITLKHNITGHIIEESMSKFNDAKDDAGTFLLLTTEEDTMQLFTMLLNKPVQNSGLKVFMFSWYLHVLQPNDVNRVIDEVVVIWPKLPTSAMSGSSSGNPWYEQQFQSPSSGNESSVDVLQLEESRLAFFISQAVEKLVSSVSLAYSNMCSPQERLCKHFTDFLSLKKVVGEEMIPGVRSLQDTIDINSIQFDGGQLVVHKIGEVSSAGDVSLIRDRSVVLPTHSECHGWCSKCRRCEAKGKPDDQMLHLQGDILISGVFPIHQRGPSSFKCGLVSGLLGSERVVEAFMYAIESSKSRYPYLLPSVTVGGIVFDSCSDSSRAIQSIGNFESCSTSFSKSASWAPDPSSNMGYVLHAGDGVNQDVWKAVKHLGSIVLTTDADGNELPSLSEDSSGELEAISSVLLQLNWTEIVILATHSDSHVQFVQSFLETASRSKICIFKIFYFKHYDSESLRRIANELTLSRRRAVIVLAHKTDTLKLFQHNDIIRFPRPWLVSITDDDWRSISDVNFPYGSILLDKKGKFSKHFEEFSVDFKIHDSSLNPWWRQYWQERFQCRLPGMISNHDASCPSTSDSREQPSTIAAKIIKGVDLILHSIHDRYVQLCPNSMGLCARFVEEGLPALPTVLKSISFESEQETVKFADSNKLEASYLINSYQPRGAIKVGEWHDSHLVLDSNKVKFYDNTGNLLSSTRYSQCDEDCVCLNINSTTERYDADSTPDDQVYDHDYFYKSSGEFNGVLWATVITAIAASGAFISFVLMLYVLYKVCCGALAKRHVWLGFVLLIGVMLLYLSVIPFTFTPSEGVCGLRYFAPGFSYALCFASILVKLTSLRDYRLIGLGGEVSNLNQILSVLFVTGVQIAVGVQYWVESKPMLLTRSLGSDTLFACSLEKKEFAVYLVYIMILIVTCSIYGIGVRNERKNMGEAKLLLTCSWLCIVVWVAWLVVFFVLNREYTDASVCVAILACATLMLVGIFIPKIHLVSRLKYDVSKHASGTMSNGYKVDPDFFFERPYSLPGTLTSTYSSMKTFPKSITNFDSSMSY